MTKRLPVHALDPAGGTPGQVAKIDASGFAVEWGADAGGGGGGGGGALLASHSYDPATDTLVTLGTSDADVDATNLAVAFTVPDSGIVIAKWTALVVLTAPTTTGSTSCGSSWREGAGTVAGSKCRLALIAASARDFQGRLTHSSRVTGLTPGAVKTWKAGGAAVLGTGGSPSVRIGYGAGAPLGAAVLGVWAG